MTRSAGTAFVEIDADLSPLNRKLAELRAKDVRVTVKADPDRSSFARTEAAVERLGGKESVEVKADADRTSFARAGAASGTLGKQLDSLGFSIGKTNRNFQFMRNSMRLIKWPALITGAGVAAQGLSAAAAGATALTGALTPSIGLATQYGTALGVLGQVAGVAAFAQINDLTQALGGNEEALKRLTPEARAFAKTLQSYKPQLDSIRSAVQKPLFAGLTNGLRDAMKNFGPFRGVIRGTARVLGDLSERFGAFLGSKGFGRDLQRIGNTNNRVLSRLGRGAINLAHALIDVMVAARPLTDWLSKMALGWTKNVKAQAEAGRKSGALADFFKETRQVVARLVSLLGNLGGALWNIVRIGKPLGDSILKALDQSAKSFKDWTESAKGKNRIAEWFEKAQKPLMAMGRLTGDVVKAFFQLAETPGLTKLINALDRDLLPVLVRLIRVTTKAFAPELIDLGVAYARLLGDLAGTSGPLTLMVKALTLFAKGLHEVFEWSPFIKGLTVNLLGLHAVISSIGLIKGLSEWFGFSKGLQTISGGRIKSATDLVKKLGGAMGALRNVATNAADHLAVWGSEVLTNIRAKSGRIKTAMRNALLRGRAAVQAATSAAADLAGTFIASMAGRIRGGAGRLRNVLSRVVLRGRAMISAVSGAAFAIGDILVQRVSTRIRTTGGKRFGKAFGVALAAGLVLALPYLIPQAFKLGKRLGDAISRQLTLKIQSAINWVIGALNKVIDAINSLPGPQGDIGHIGALDNIPAPGEAGRSRRRARRANRLLNLTFGPPGGAKGGLVTESGIRYLAAGGPARGTDTVPTMLTPGEGIVNLRGMARLGTTGLKALNSDIGLEGQHGKKLLEATKKVTAGVAKVMQKNLGDGNKRTSDDTAKFVEKHKRLLTAMRDTGAKLTQRFRDNTIGDFEKAHDRGQQLVDRLRGNVSDDFTRMRQQAGDQSGRLRQGVTEQFDRTRDRATKSTEKMKGGVSGDYRSMVGAVNDGLSKIAKMTNNALKALGVKKVEFNIGVQGGGEGKRLGGRIDAPGAPAIGDHIPAMLEKDEFVVNSRASKKHRRWLEWINWHDAPRHQLGGTAGMQPQAAALARSFVQRFGGAISSGLRPGDDGFHGRGMAFDWVGGDWTSASRYANQIGPQILEGIHQAPPGVNVSWDSGQKVSPSFWGSGTWAEHVSHIHIATAAKIAGAIVKEIKRVIVKGGPEGPLTDIPQASLDRARAAATKLIDRKSASTGIEGLNVPTGPIQEMAHQMVRQTWGESQWPPFEQLEMSEAGWNPRAQNPSSGAAGLAQALPPSKYPPGAWPYRGLESAKLQLQWMMNYVQERYGNPAGAWAFHQSHNWYQRGGIVDLWGKGLQHLQKGGGARGDEEKAPNFANLSLKKLVQFTKGDHPGKQKSEAFDRLLDELHKAAKGAPVKEFGKLHKQLEHLKRLELHKQLHPKSGGPVQQLHGFLKGHAVEMIHQLTGRKDKYSHLLLKKRIAATTKGERDDERIDRLIDRFLGKGEVRSGLLEKIQKARKGVPIRPFGHLNEYLDELDVLVLKKQLHHGDKKSGRALHHFLDEEGRYILSTLKLRARTWKELQLRQKIAAKTPGKEDDERVGKLIVDFLGKKPGEPGGESASATAASFFDFLKLTGLGNLLAQYAGPFGKGGLIGAGKWGIAGETGRPEIVEGPARVYSPSQSAGMLAAPQVNLEINVYEREDGTLDVEALLDDKRLDAKVNKIADRRDRNTERRHATGVSSIR